MTFERVLEILRNLMDFIISAEMNLGPGCGNEKRAVVIAEYSIFLDSLPENEKAALPTLLQDPLRVVKVVDLLVGIGNFLICKVGVNLISKLL